jgi:sigma-E factor negative regulatory protein RseA
MKERISALMDGELEGRAAEETVDLLRGEGDAAATWRIYHLVSDAMHGQRLLSAGFAERVAVQLAAEPAPLALGALPGRTPLQRFTLAAAASIAAVALVAWLAFAPQPQTATPVAQASSPSPVVVVLPHEANDYLLAHQGFSPRVTLQGMAPYVRTVAERPDEFDK